jgi:alkylhydroperoxidase family enzyme
VRQVLDDYTTAPIDDKLRATLGLLKKMTLDHGNLGPEDVRAVLRTGVSKQAIQDAFEVAFLFNIYDKLADSMGWDVPAISGGYYQVVAKRLLRHGYGG